VRILIHCCVSTKCVFSVPLKSFCGSVYIRCSGCPVKKQSSNWNTELLIQEFDGNIRSCSNERCVCFRDASRELVLAHVKEHYQQRLQQASSNGAVGSSDSAEASVRRGLAPFRCGHCHQVSNWKHVIQVQLTTFTTNCMG
jgi:hypothetical protein